MAKVYSPTEDFAIPIGRKPAAVINVPVSIGIAVSEYAAVAAVIRSAPSSSLRTIISTTMMASSTSNPSAMIKEPREILCNPTPQSCMIKKVTANTKGMLIATTRPGRGSIRHGWRCKPSAKRLTPRTIAIASISTVKNSLTELATTRG